MTDTDADASEIDRIVADYLRDIESGRSPDPADVLARYPAHAAELSRFFMDIGRYGSFLGLAHRPTMDETIDLTAQTEPRGDGGRFGDYELLGEIGRGAMGIVYRARSIGTNLEVALKQVRPAGRDGARVLGRFREEVENASGLRHPHIVPIYHVGELAGRPFYTMALIAGGSLDEKIDRYQSDPRAAVTLVAKVARAVHYAHQRRLLHRDLKPGNILLDEAGEPHVADFGLASRLNSGGEVTGGPMAGSLPWMSPEAVRGDSALTTAVDVWALGVILYELLTGQRPFPGDDRNEVRRAILDGEPRPARIVNPRIDRDLEAVCARCLEKDPDRRYESATELALDLERWLRDEPVRARRPGQFERLVKWSRRHPTVASGVGLLMLLIAAGVVAAVSMAREQEKRLRREVCRGNEFAARHVASSVLGRLREYGDAVHMSADDDALHRACRDRDSAAVEKAIRRLLLDSPVEEGAPPFATAFVLDPDGTIQAEWPQRRQVVGENFRNRDYFRGAMVRADLPDRDRVHLSRVFNSKNDGLDKLAFSVPFRPMGPKGPTWVLGATVPTNPSLGLDQFHDERRKALAVLVAPRESGGHVILVHRGYPIDHPEPSVLFPEERLQPEGSGYAPDDDYRDPIAERHPEYSGRWLAGFAPVPGTELIVLVQQPYDEAVAPHRAFFRRFLEWVAAALGLGMLLIAGIWYARTRRSRSA